MKNRRKLYRKLCDHFLIIILLAVVTISFAACGKSKVRMIKSSMASQQKIVLLMRASLQECNVWILKAAMVRNDMNEYGVAQEGYEAKQGILREQCEMILKGRNTLSIPAATPGSLIDGKVRMVSDRLGVYAKVADNILTRKRQLMSGLRAGAVDEAAMKALSDESLYKLLREDLQKASDMTLSSIDELNIAVMSQQ